VRAAGGVRTGVERAATVLEVVAAGAALAYIALYASVAVRRMTFPFDLEWMEGGSVEHVRRVLEGQRIYARPSLKFISFVYPPLFYYVSAVVSRVLGPGYVPLRLVSFVSSLGGFGLVYRLVERDTASRYAGLIAAGAAAATYRIGGAWFDLARVDSLFLLLLLAAAYLLRSPPGRAWMWSGILLGLSAMTKQTALLLAVPLGGYALIVDWRRGLAFLGTFAALVAAATIALDVWHRGWFLYYAVWLPAAIQASESNPVDFWRGDLVSAMPIACIVGVGVLAAGRRLGEPRWLFYSLFVPGMVVASWLSRLHEGGHSNVLIPAYAALAILLGLGAHQWAEWAGASQSALSGLVRSAVACACLLQFWSLRYDPAWQIPTARDRGLQQELAQLVEGTPGEVYVVHHAYVPGVGSRASHAHAWAVYDIIRVGGAENSEHLQAEIQEMLAERRFQLIVLDRFEPWLQPAFDRAYRAAGAALSSDGLWTRAGHDTRPRVLYRPRAE
jgi:hypothetical protein